ncbi:hypothetical protein TpMuguga_01g00208 [Theileria parva strain Muguga]|uniref:Mediator complex subunit 18 n=1 Tax=Theileria parva TaxID=5875 RepID=Q4N9A6_THEPA|nr:uncharacterized protein TpMuguga_01g00208 [Theileria parva strain Muguga]EAN33452.1 hypothetical protein TpMuguga_01g00208 [Theileria parva strain Muguga]|eukprot:XP_765735.1 hypothetical protein [Theileria parva strain Muguga]
MGNEPEVNSDDELLSLLHVSGGKFSKHFTLDSGTLLNEYTKYGIFKDEKPSDSQGEFNSSSLYFDFINTLKNLSDAHTSHEYVRYLFVKDKQQSSNNINFSRSEFFDDTIKHYEVLVHIKPYNMIEKCTLREIEGVPGVTDPDNLTVKTVNSMLVHADIVDVIPSLGFKLSKKQNVSSEVFHINYGSNNYVQISVMRHMEDKEDLFPSTFLVEIKCFGNLELEFYKNRINTTSKLLYKFVKF